MCQIYQFILQPNECTGARTHQMPTSHKSAEVQHPMVFSDVSNWVKCLFISVRINSFLLPTGLIALLHEVKLQHLGWHCPLASKSNSFIHVPCSLALASQACSFSPRPLLWHNDLQARWWIISEKCSHWITTLFLYFSPVAVAGLHVHKTTWLVTKLLGGLIIPPSPPSQLCNLLRRKAT